VGSITGSKWPETKNFLLKLISLFLFWEMMAIPCEKLLRNWRSRTTLCTEQKSLHRTAQTGPNQNRKRSGRLWCTTEQDDKYIRVFSLRNRCFTSSQLAASLKSTRKTPVSTSTVKRRLLDAGLCRQSSSVQCLCTFAHMNISFLLASLRYGFFFATLPRRQASRSHCSSLLMVRQCNEMFTCRLTSMQQQ
jgi:hypothetical protein